MITFGLILGTGDASAALVSVSFCGEWSVGYTDVTSVVSQLDDDFIEDASDLAARGGVVKFTNNNTGVAITWPLPDADPACTPSFMLENTHTYNLQLRAHAELNGNVIQVKNNDTDNDLWYYQGPTTWTPVAGTKPLNTPVHAAWNILGAASWALHRGNAGLSGQTFNFYTQDCPSDPGATLSCTDDATHIYIDPVHDEKKYIVAHEMGHAVAWARTGFNPVYPLLAPDTCGSNGNLGNKMYAGPAAEEGIAWYFAAVAFNSTGGSTCEIAKTGLDLDQDGIFGEALNNELTPSCEGNGALESWATADYLSNECGGTLEDRGTSLDYMRAFWDADHNQGLSLEINYDIFDTANPQNWDGNGGSGADDPQERLEAASVTEGVSVQWNAVDGANGVR